MVIPSTNVSYLTYHPIGISITILALTTIVFFIIKCRTCITSRPITLPPGPTPWPFIGSLLELLRSNVRFRWVQSVIEMVNADIACIRVGNVHIIPVSFPKIACEILKTQDVTFASRPITMTSQLSSFNFKAIAVTPWGDQWKKMRRMMASNLLSRSRLDWLHDKREEEADNLVRFIYNQCVSNGFDGEVVNVRFLIRAFVGNVIRRLMFNIRYFGKDRSDGGPTVEEVEHVEALFTILDFLYAFCISDYIPGLKRFDLDGHEKVVKDTLAAINKKFDPLIDQRIKEWRCGEDRDNHKNKKQEDLLDVMISLKNDQGQPLLSNDEIKAQTAEMHYAFIDNQSNIVEWVMAEMMNHPEILCKEIDEIDNVVGKDRLVQECDISKLNYVKAYAREALRLHPVAPFNLPHVSNADAIVAGYFIPKGSHVLLSRIGLGRSLKVWDEPLKFNPDRHLDDTKTQVELGEPDLRFISFTTGRRGCLGGSLATVVTIMLLARLLQGFQWSMQHGDSTIDLSESNTSMYMAKPLHLHAKPRLPLHLYPTN